MKPHLLWLLPLLGLSACAGQHRDSDNAVSPLDPSLPDAPEPREPSHVHAYIVNDYIDPNNPRLLHRGHVVDVVDQDEKWNLEPVDASATTAGPVDTATDPNAAPNPYSAEFETELAQQREQYQQLAGLGAQMTAEMEKLQEMAQKNADAISENAALRNRLNELQQEIDELKPPPATPIAPDAPKKPSWLDSVWQLFRQVPNGKPVAQDKPNLHANTALRPEEMPLPAPALTNAPSGGQTNATNSTPSEPSIPDPGAMAQPETNTPPQP